MNAPLVADLKQLAFIQKLSFRFQTVCWFLHSMIYGSQQTKGWKIDIARDGSVANKFIFITLFSSCGSENNGENAPLIENLTMNRTFAFHDDKCEQSLRFKDLYECSGSFHRNIENSNQTNSLFADTDLRKIKFSE